MPDLKSQVGDMLSKFKEIQQKLQDLIKEYDLKSVRKVLQEIEGEAFTKDALRKLMDGLWKS